MKTENVFGMNNSINKKRKLYQLNLTWNKFRKAKENNQSVKNSSKTFHAKSLSPTNYYKDPFFLNEFNLKSQLLILRAINNEKTNINKAFMEENLPTIYSLTNNSIYSRKHNFDINDYYNRVFKMKPLFRKIKPVVDNKLNMRYAETEEQYKKLIEKENKVLLSQGKKIKNKNTSVYITKKVDDLKTRIRFMKGIIDFSFPGFVLTKIKAIDKKLKKENEKRYKSKDFSSPVEKRNLTQNKRNEERKAYLCECFNIRSDLNKINN